MQAPSAPSLRLRLLEPSVGVVTGGTRVVLHGAGFRPPPHSLTVRLRVDLQDVEYDNHSDKCDQLSWTTRPSISNTVDISGRFVLDTQLECVLPSFERQAARAIAARTCLAASSASVSSAPQLVPLSVEVILNGGEQRSNTLSFKLHQPLEVRRIFKQASERTGAVSEQTREGKWKLSPLGVYEVGFDAPTMGFGAASVEITLNRTEFFRCKSDAPPEGFGYRVRRDVALRAVEPACISVTSGQVTEVKLVGDGFVDSGDIVVAMLQKELSSTEADAAKPAKEVQVAQLNATYYGKNEVRCTVPANLPFGCTSFSVSLNGGRQFGQSRVVGLLHRDRALEGISPASSSLAGGTTVMIRYSCLSLEDADAFYQLQRLDPPRRIHVRFQPASYSGTDGGGLAKVVNAEASSQTPGVLIFSYDAGVTFFPVIDPPPTAAQSNLLAKDLSYLCFLFYPPPVVRSAIPLSADILGGSCIRLQGENLVDHGAQMSVIFESSSMSRKVSAFVEKGELRCFSFEFAERIATPTVDFRFGDSLPSSGRIREERFVECFSPELSAGTHCISISFNEQHYEPAVLMERQVEQLKDSEHSVATFHAFPLPVFVLPPAGRDRVYAFGPTSGGTVVVIKGKGFVPDTKIYVRFASQFKDAFDGQSEIIVSAKVMDGETIRCISPPSMRLGRAVLHVSYNLQQFSDSTCFFEYHAPTRYVAKGTLCGPISGQTPMKLIVEDMKGLPSLTQLLQCVVRFESEKHGVSSDVEAQFDPESCILSCITPAWPINELVGLRVSLSRGEGELFEDTQIKFLFYDPPEGVIKIEPAAGPIGGGTEVLAWCGSIVETGEITKFNYLIAAAISEIKSTSAAVHTVLGISLNGINYTSTQSPLHFTYYVEPILRRINPGWAALEGAYEALVIEGEHIRDFGCKLLVRFSLQDEKQPEHNDIVVALISSGVTGVDTIPHFGRDEVSFVMYKTPTIKSVAPLTALVSGVSTTEIIVQGFEEKAVSNMRLAPKLRFKRRGQMQVSDAQLVSESRFECVVPRFNVTNAKNACNPFAVVYVGKAQLKSTRKDGVFSPVWNELFDFEWTSNSDSNLPSVRVVFENQLTADQSESLGHVELKFPVKDKVAQPFALRAWFPLRRIRGKYYRKENEEVAVQVQKNSKKQAISTLNLGEVELAIAFIPPVAQIKKHKKALRSSIISVITTQPQSRKQSQGKGGSGIYSSKKEKLLRAFRQRGAPISLVPTELAVELALNGQDFWSVAPLTCYSILTPIVVDVEPKFISIAGGSTLHVSGNNFVNTGCLRVAFAVLTKDGTTQTLRSECTIVVEAKYRSSTSLVCTTPPLLNLATEASYVNVYVSLNGSDFDSIALPKQLLKLSEPAAERPQSSVNFDERIEESDETVVEESPRKSPRITGAADDKVNEPQAGNQVDASKEDAVRTPHTLAQATVASTNKDTRTIPPSSPAPSPANTNAIMPRQANLSGPNPFYNDIAPLYAKFLNSTEVKRFLKH
ncbi:hypothetical protein JG687_00000429 [Phytophthora cactorum]|uniref:C2 domain-containing protein n=1 Tax=Phytophthora cactorum TaxID=29920 RepID=A0A8T1V4W7_9STRA|nr:hypothetical protein JG687_00000429 [Phytophthora cactorum]